MSRSTRTTGVALLAVLAAGLTAIGVASPAAATTGNLSAPSPQPGWMGPAMTAASCPTPTVRVTDGTSLRVALQGAGPGTVIGLADGLYSGRFVLTRSGAAGNPAVLCGGPGAVLDAGDQTSGYVLHIDGADHWVLQGFTVRNGQKGVMADGTTGTTIRGLQVYGIGDEAVHLRRHSADNVVEQNRISDTGRRRAEFGEGIYIGTAVSNWCTVTACGPDLSDRNLVVGNRIWATTAEAVDLKEGTSHGRVTGNAFDGSALSGADSWLDAKGNDWTIDANTGRSTPLDGFQTHDVADGWGTRNVFSGNSGALQVSTGYLVALRPVNANVVSCTNTLLAAVGRVTNVTCAVVAAPPPVTVTPPVTTPPPPPAVVPPPPVTPPVTPPPPITNPPPVTSPPPVAPSGDEAFVRELYLDFLGRTASAAEVTHWVSAMNQGLGRLEVAAALSRSDEWVAAVIARFYRDTLGREPDPAGLADWTRVARSGVPLAEIAAGFYGSDEYFARIGGGDRETWVRDLYVKLLGRTAEAGGVADWLRALAAGASRQQVAHSFYQSVETSRVRVDRLYRSLLDRGAEEGGLQTWGPVVLAQGDLALAAFLASSHEYYVRAGT